MNLAKRGINRRPLILLALFAAIVVPLLSPARGSAASMEVDCTTLEGQVICVLTLEITDLEESQSPTLQFDLTGPGPTSLQATFDTSGGNVRKSSNIESVTAVPGGFGYAARSHTYDVVIDTTDLDPGDYAGVSTLKSGETIIASASDSFAIPGEGAAFPVLGAILVAGGIILLMIIIAYIYLRQRRQATQTP